MAKAPIRLVQLPQLPRNLKTILINPSVLFRVSGHNTGEPFFGKNNSNRFDDPSLDTKNRFGTCYLGTTLAVAIAETLLHDRKPTKSYFVIELSVILNRYIIEFSGKDLILADLTGAELKRLGGHAALSGTSSYKTTKNWSAAIHTHPDNVDGFIYMSRHKNDEKAIVLFDRASKKLRMRSAIPLSTHPEFGQVATDLYIRSSSPK